MPISNKVAIAQERDILIKELIIEGVVSIKEGENPKYIEEKLMNFVESSKKKKDEDGEDKKAKKKKK
jgi:chemotaxis protein MotA